MEKLFSPEFSDPGSNARRKEEAIIVNWVEFLEDVEGIDK